MENNAEEAGVAPQLQVSAIRVFVADLAIAQSFYEDVLGLPAESTNEDWAVFNVGGIHLIIEAADADDPEGQALVGRFLGVSLTSTDILSTFDILSERGVTFMAPPAKQDWGGYLAHFYDPDRNVISLVG